MKSSDRHIACASLAHGKQHQPLTASQCGTAPVRTGVASSGTLSGAVASIPFPLKAVTSTMLRPLGSRCNVSDTFAVRPSDGVARILSTSGCRRPCSSPSRWPVLLTRQTSLSPMPPPTSVSVTVTCTSSPANSGICSRLMRGAGPESSTVSSETLGEVIFGGSSASVAFTSSALLRAEASCPSEYTLTPRTIPSICAPLGEAV